VVHFLDDGYHLSCCDVGSAIFSKMQVVVQFVRKDELILIWENLMDSRLNRRGVAAAEGEELRALPMEVVGCCCWGLNEAHFHL